MKKKYKVTHKTEGWTGTMEFDDFREDSTASHRIHFTIKGVIYQDAYKPDGTYVEDPSIYDLDELEIEEI